jgi:hypothetical protein
MLLGLGLVFTQGDSGASPSSGVVPGIASEAKRTPLFPIIDEDAARPRATVAAAALDVQPLDASADPQETPWRVGFGDDDLPLIDTSAHPLEIMKLYMEHRLQSLRETVPGVMQLLRAEQLDQLALAVILGQAGLGETVPRGATLSLDPHYPGEQIFSVNGVWYRYDENEFPESKQLQAARREYGELVQGDFDAESKGLKVNWALNPGLLDAVEARVLEALGFLEAYGTTGN